MTRRSRPEAIWFAGSAVIALLAGAASRANAEGVSFESLARDVQPIADAGLLAMALGDDCADTRREIDRARCRAISHTLKDNLPKQTFVARVDAAGIQLSDYDAAVAGYRLTVSGCLVCDEPIEVGSGRLPRFVTVGVPQKVRGVDELARSAPLFEAPVKFSSMDEAKAWGEASRDRLTAEILFQPSAVEWRLRDDHGYAFKLVGLRVSNRCTGEVLMAQPQSGLARLPVTDDAGCSETPTSLGGDAAEGKPTGAPRTLNARAIAQAIEPIRARLDACIASFKMGGSAYLRFSIDATGAVRRVTVEGGANGTTLGQCLVEVAAKAKFPPIAGESQEFRYPVVLQAK